RGGQEEQQLVPERALGDLVDDRQLTRWGQADDVLRRDGGVVDDDTRGLAARPPGRTGNVIDGSGGELCQRGDVVEQGDQTTGHANSSTVRTDATRWSSRSCRGIASATTIGGRESMRRSLAFALISAGLVLGGSALAQAPAATEAISTAVADAARPDADKARDAVRKPAEIVAFAGIEPGDKVAEIAPGGGYYTRILSKAVGPQGKVYALMPAFFANRPGGLDAINALAEQYGNVEVVVIDYAATELPEPVDLVWTTENYHDLANGDIAAVNGWVFKALKPGGIYFVEDHAAPGTGTSATSTLHR